MGVPRALGSTGATLSYLTLRPIPHPFNIALMLDRNQSAHREGEEHEWYGWVDQRSDDGKESKSRQCAAGEAAPQSHEQKPLPFQPYPC